MDYQDEFDEVKESIDKISKYIDTYNGLEVYQEQLNLENEIKIDIENTNKIIQKLHVNIINDDRNEHFKNKNTIILKDLEKQCDELKNKINSNKMNIPKQGNYQIQEWKGDKMNWCMINKIKEIKKITYETKDMMEDINNEIIRQREKLLEIDDEIKESQSISNRCKETVKFFANHFNNDLLYKINFFIIFILLLLIIIITIFKNKSIKESDNQLNNINIFKFNLFTNSNTDNLNIKNNNKIGYYIDDLFS